MHNTDYAESQIKGNSSSRTSDVPVFCFKFTVTGVKGVVAKQDLTSSLLPSKAIEQLETLHNVWCPFLPICCFLLTLSLHLSKIYNRMS